MNKKNKKSYFEIKIPYQITDALIAAGMFADWKYNLETVGTITAVVAWTASLTRISHFYALKHNPKTLNYFMHNYHPRSTKDRLYNTVINSVIIGEMFLTGRYILLGVTAFANFLDYQKQKLLKQK